MNVPWFRAGFTAFSSELWTFGQGGRQGPAVRFGQNVRQWLKDGVHEFGRHNAAYIQVHNFRRRQDVASIGQDCGRDDRHEGHAAFVDLATGVGGVGGLDAGHDGGGLAVVGGAEERAQLPSGFRETDLGCRESAKRCCRRLLNCQCFLKNKYAHKQRV